jgi:MYXO-CTERM domain-containing protein
MKPIRIFLAASLLAATSAPAATGIFGTFLFADTSQNGSFVTSEFYGADEPNPDTLPALNGANLGVFAQGTTVILSGEILTWKNGGSDVTGATLRYEIFPSGAPTGTFAALPLGFTANATFNGADGQTFTCFGDQKWAQPASTPNMLAGLAPGNYQIAAYFESSTNEGTKVDNNGGGNYVASFTVVPEPASFALGLVGLAAVFGRRRR